MFRGMAALCLFGVTVMLRPRAHDVRPYGAAAYHKPDLQGTVLTVPKHEFICLFLVFVRYYKQQRLPLKRTMPFSRCKGEKNMRSDNVKKARSAPQTAACSMPWATPRKSWNAR